MASDVAAQPHIKAGKLIGLAVDVESAILPDVPTFAKQGYARSICSRASHSWHPKACQKQRRKF
jgi:tripartite-type tricarboxylate transporter receptor subunit TctC